jgi:hypothetical protein
VSKNVEYGRTVIICILLFLVEVEELAKHGTFLPPNMLGLTEEQVEELKLVDEWGENCVPSGGFNLNKDPLGRRNGKQPLDKMGDVLNRTVGEARAMIAKVLMLRICIRAYI